jgi:predicted transcriptional regulator
LKLNRTLIGFSLILLIAVLFATLIYRQNTAFAAITPGSIFLTTFNLEANVAERPATIFNNATRVEIYNFIKANPGVQFRGICTQLGISIGVAEFHLGVLKKAGLISFFRDGKYKRFFESKKFSQKKMELISLLRHDTTKSIIKTMLDEKQVSHGELAYHLSITSQGVTWQMNQLKKEGIIQENRENTKVTYALEETYAPLLTELVNLIEQP